MLNAKVTALIKMRTLNCMKDYKKESLASSCALTISDSGGNLSYVQGTHLQ